MRHYYCDDLRGAGINFTCCGSCHDDQNEGRSPSDECIVILDGREYWTCCNGLKAVDEQKGVGRRAKPVVEHPPVVEIHATHDHREDREKNEAAPGEWREVRDSERDDVD